MKTVTKIALAAVMVLTTGVSAMAQQSFEENPLYGKTVEERKKNVADLNWLKDAVSIKDWDTAAGYVSNLMNTIPNASMNLYQWAVQTYRARIQRATSVADKNVLLDSLMLIYDRRAEHFGNHATQGTAYIKAMKAQDYIAFNPLDGENVRKYYKEAVEAAGEGVQPLLVLTYFSHMVNGYKAVEVTPDELLATYEELSPLLEGASQEDKDKLVSFFATSGAADCGVLEGIYTNKLAENPGDVETIKQGFRLMTMAKCESDFYISLAEQYYAAEPTSEVAIHLAMIFENRKEFDKAIPYLNEMIEIETDPNAKSDLYARVAASQYGKNSYSGTAQAARQAIALNSSNGAAHAFLGMAYIGGAQGCDGFDRQTVYWLAADELSRARENLAGDTTGLLDIVNSNLAGCRGNFPTNEDIFLYGYQPGASFSVSCGWVTGTTTVRAR